MNPEISAWPLVLLILFVSALAVAGILLSWYGVYLSFKKKWYIGAVALVIHPFAFVVGTAKFFFKKDLLK